MTQIGYVSLVSPPTQTNAGSDTTLTFASVVSQVTVQNNTNAVVYVNFDAAASPGTYALAAGNTLIETKSCKAVHLYTVAAQNVNGSTAGNIVVLGEV